MGDLTIVLYEPVSTVKIAHNTHTVGSIVLTVDHISTRMEAGSWESKFTKVVVRQRGARQHLHLDGPHRLRHQVGVLRAPGRQEGGLKSADLTACGAPRNFARHSRGWRDVTLDQFSRS